LQHKFETDKKYVGNRPVFRQIGMSCQQHKNKMCVRGLNISLSFLAGQIVCDDNEHMIKYLKRYISKSQRKFENTDKLTGKLK